MQNNFTFLQTNTFENPFDDVNANTITPDKILALWCTPFDTESLKNMSERKFRTQRLPIILQGSRGTGKTTILKYCSYPVLKERAKSLKTQSLLQEISFEKSIGFYFRCDDSFINTFKSIFESQSKDRWVAFFEHYLELQFCLHIVTVINDVKGELISLDTFEHDLIELIKSGANVLPSERISTIEDIHGILANEIRYIDTFKNESIFSDSEFKPSILLSLYSLSGEMINSLCTLIPQFHDIIFLILIDEFENLGEEIQQLINTAIKFSKERISLRIGRRSEGTVTTATINNTEYLREKHDYFLVEISKGMNLASQRKYFYEIAEKRLLFSSELSNSNGIIGILGDKENLDRECLEICKGREDHLRLILSEKSILNTDEELRNKIIDIIKNPSNPIAETINAFWVIRSKEEPISAANRARAAMDSYFSKAENADSKKYHNDYDNKYRYTITALLASLYKRMM